MNTKNSFLRFRENIHQIVLLRDMSVLQCFLALLIQGQEKDSKRGGQKDRMRKKREKRFKIVRKNKVISIAPFLLIVLERKREAVCLLAILFVSL